MRFVRDFCGDVSWGMFLGDVCCRNVPVSFVSPRWLFVLKGLFGESAFVESFSIGVFLGGYLFECVFVVGFVGYVENDYNDYNYRVKYLVGRSISSPKLIALDEHPNRSPEI